MVTSRTYSANCLDPFEVQWIEGPPLVARLVVVLLQILLHLRIDELLRSFYRLRPQRHVE